MSTDKKQTPPFPNEPVVDKEGRVNRSWFYFFLNFFKKAEKLDDTATLLASGAYDTPKEYFKRIHTIEQGLAAIEQPRDYNKEISELRTKVEVVPSVKDYSKDIDSLTKGVISELWKPSSPDYQKRSEKDNANGYAGLNASTRTTKGKDTTDDVIVDLATKGLVLKDTQVIPHYWRVTVSILGALVTADLGVGKP